MNETSFVHSITKRRLQIKAQAQAADFYTPNQFSFEEGLPMDHLMCDWQDHELVNTKQGWINLGLINGNLLSGDHQDCAGNLYQTMAGIEIKVDSDEFQQWYKAFTTFPSQAISEAQYQIHALINK